MSFDLSKPNRTIRAAVVLMGGVTEIVDVAPMDMISGLSKKFVEFISFPDHLLKQAYDVDIWWVNEKGDDARLTSNATVKCSHSFENCPPLDIVLVGATSIEYIPNEREKAFLRKAYDECSAFITICDGFLMALHAGILEGKVATCPRMLIREMRETHPETTWVDKRWAHDGKVWTSGVLINGFALMTAFARETWGNELVEYWIHLGSWPDKSVVYDDGEN